MTLAVVAAFRGGRSPSLSGRRCSSRSPAAPPPRRRATDRFFVRIAQHPSWLVGLVLSAVAFSLHAFALSRGDLALVQPIIVSGIVFAVVIRAALEHRFPAASTLVWLVITWAGLALFLAVRPPTSDGPPRSWLGAVLVGVGVVLALAGTMAASRTRRPQLRGAILAASAGILYGLVAGMVKLVLARFGGGVGAVLASWPLWTLVVTGTGAILLNQRAYQATRLSVTTPHRQRHRGRRRDHLRPPRPGREPRSFADHRGGRARRARARDRRGDQAGVGRGARARGRAGPGRGGPGEVTGPASRARGRC